MSGDCDKCGEHCLECVCEKVVYLLFRWSNFHSEFGTMVTGVWSSYEGAKIAFDHYKKVRPDFCYSIASHPIYEENEGLF